MANVFVTSPTFTTTVNGANTYILPPGSTGPTSPVSRWEIELANSAFNGTLIVKARLAGNNGTWKAVPYFGDFVNGAVGTGLPVTANLGTNGAAMTGDTLIAVDAAEREVALDCTAFTSGSAVLTARLIQG